MLTSSVSRHSRVQSRFASSIESSEEPNRTINQTFLTDLPHDQTALGSTAIAPSATALIESRPVAASTAVKLEHIPLPSRPQQRRRTVEYIDRASLPFGSGFRSPRVAARSNYVNGVQYYSFPKSPSPRSVGVLSPRQQIMQQQQRRGGYWEFTAAGVRFRPYNEQNRPAPEEAKKRSSSPVSDTSDSVLDIARKRERDRERAFTEFLKRNGYKFDQLAGQQPQFLSEEEFYELLELSDQERLRALRSTGANQNAAQEAAQPFSLQDYLDAPAQSSATDHTACSRHGSDIRSWADRYSRFPVAPRLPPSQLQFPPMNASATRSYLAALRARRSLQAQEALELDDREHSSYCGRKRDFQRWSRQFIDRKMQQEKAAARGYRMMQPGNGEATDNGSFMETMREKMREWDEFTRKDGMWWNGKMQYEDPGAEAAQVTKGQNANRLMETPDAQRLIQSQSPIPSSFPVDSDVDSPTAGYFVSTPRLSTGVSDSVRSNYEAEFKQFQDAYWREMRLRAQQADQRQKNERENRVLEIKELERIQEGETIELESERDRTAAGQLPPISIKLPDKAGTAEADPSASVSASSQSGVSKSNELKDHVDVMKWLEIQGLMKKPVKTIKKPKPKRVVLKDDDGQAYAAASGLAPPHSHAWYGGNRFSPPHSHGPRKLDVSKQAQANVEAIAKNLSHLMDIAERPPVPPSPLVRERVEKPPPALPLYPVIDGVLSPRSVALTTGSESDGLKRQLRVIRTPDSKSRQTFDQSEWEIAELEEFRRTAGIDGIPSLLGDGGAASDSRPMSSQSSALASPGAISPRPDLSALSVESRSAHEAALLGVDLSVNTSEVERLMSERADQLRAEIERFHAEHPSEDEAEQDSGEFEPDVIG